MAKFITVHEMSDPSLAHVLNVETIVAYHDNGGSTPNGHTSMSTLFGGWFTFDESPADITDLINAVDDI